MVDSETRASRVAEIIRDSGGEIVGRVRMQKVAFFLELAGLGSGYKFSYHYYGPYSEALDTDSKIAWAFDKIQRADRQTSWGDSYSIFSVDNESIDTKCASIGPRQKLASIAASTDSVILELAATAAYLKTDGYDNPWEETRKRKPQETSKTRVDAAMKMYEELLTLDTPKELPDIL